MSDLKSEAMSTAGLGNEAFASPSTLHKIFRLLVKRRRWIAGSIVVGVLIAIIVIVMMKPTYQATATIELNKSNASLDLGLGDEVSQGLTGGIDSLQNDLQTETAILQNDSLALVVITELNLASQPEYAGLAGGATKTAPLPLEEDSQERARLLAIFRSHLKLQTVHGTRLIQITFESHNRELAAKIANELIEAYKNQYLQSHYDATIATSSWLTKQLSDLKANVEASEQKLTNFERENGILSFNPMMPPSSSEDLNVGGGLHSVIIQKLDQLNTELTAAEADRIQKEAIYRIVQSGNPEVIIGLADTPMARESTSTVVSTGKGVTNLEALRKERSLLQVNLAEAATKFGENNRHLTDIQTRIQAMDEQIRQEILEITKRAQGDFLLAKRTEESVRREFEQQEQAANRLNEKAVQASVLSQEAFSRKKLYDDLYTKLQEANVSAGINATNITIIDQARSQFYPVRPRRQSYLELGVAFGFLLGLFSAYLVDSLDRSIGSPLEIEEITGKPVIGVIPEFSDRAKGYGVQISYGIKRRDKELKTPTSRVSAFTSAWTLDHPQSPAAEAYRALRTGIMLSRAGSQPQVILITSCTAQEGKTTLTHNLGVAFAQHSKRVIILEADLRRPRLLHRPSTAPGVKGLSSVLVGSCSIDSAIHYGAQIPMLDVLPAGPPPPMPSEILGSSAFDDLLKELRSRYEIVLIDSPPALLVTDAVAISPKVDALLWIVAAGVTTKPSLARASHMIERNRMPLIGFVFNRMTWEAANYGYGYEYGYEVYSSYYAEDQTNGA